MNLEYNTINIIKLSVGGFFNGYSDIEINFNTCIVKYKYFGGREKEKISEKIVKREDLDILNKELQDCKVLEWRNEYRMLEICDGTQWEIEIVKKDEKIKKYGDNKFPIKWKKFCKAIRKILNEEIKL